MPEKASAENELENGTGPRRRRPILILFALAIVLAAIPVFLCGSWVYSVATCNEDGILKRETAVVAEPLLELAIPENSIPIQNVRYIPPKDARSIAGTVVRMARSETLTEARASFDEICDHETPWLPIDYDHAQFSFGGAGNRRYCASHILERKQFSDGTFTCDTWQYASFVVVQNEKTVITISEGTKEKNSHGEKTNLAIMEFAEDLSESFKDLEKLDAKSRVVMEIHSLTGDGRDLHGMDLSQVDLSNTSLSSADLHDSDLTATDFSGAYLPWINFRGAILKDANFQGANLAQAKFEGADLKNANLSETRLHAAKLDGVDLRSVNLQSALYNQLTTWPDGFDPEAAGAIFDGY